MLMPGVAPPGPWGRLAGRVLHQALRLSGRTRHDRTRFVRTNGFRLIVLPDVFDPCLMRTGAYFASLLEPSLTRNRQVLDMGTGSGICALAAARHARQVWAVDINPAAVRCCALNAARNGLETRIQALHSDLFGNLPSRRFDLVLFNPPFLLGTPVSDYDRAWRSTDVARRFASQLGDHLLDSGRALLLLSSFGDPGVFLKPLQAAGFQCAPHATRRYFNEVVTVFNVARRP